MNDIASQLEKLAELKDKGIITQEEFDSEKSKLFTSDNNHSQNEPVGNKKHQQNEMPPGVKGWSWGAFGFHWIWAIFNKTWIGLLAIPFTPVMAIILGFKGREWAWKNKEWESVEHFNRVQKAWSKWAVGLFCVLFIPMILFAIFTNKPGDSDSKVDTENFNNQTFDFETTANALATAYDKNTVSADMKYKGKKFKVSGVISEISTDFTDAVIITMLGGVNEFMEPQFELIDSQKMAASKLSSGQEIVLVCEGAGDIAKTPMSDNCEFYTEKSSNETSNESVVAVSEATSISNNEMTEEVLVEDAAIASADMEYAAKTETTESVDTMNVSPSFDCEKASTNAERLICSNKSLMQADKKLSESYKSALLGNIANKDAIKAMQRVWLKTIRDKCEDVECMLAAYEDRERELW